MSGQFKTVFEMKEIIERCFKECEEAGLIKKLAEQEQHVAEFETNRTDDIFEKGVIINPEAVADHISKTLIGELQEFEILRKLSPMFRQFRSIENDMKLLDEKAAQESSYANLRIGQK